LFVFKPKSVLRPHRKESLAVRIGLNCLAKDVLFGYASAELIAESILIENVMHYRLAVATIVCFVIARLCTIVCFESLLGNNLFVSRL